MSDRPGDAEGEADDSDYTEGEAEDAEGEAEDAVGDADDPNVTPDAPANDWNDTPRLASSGLCSTFPTMAL